MKKIKIVQPKVTTKTEIANLRVSVKQFYNDHLKGKTVVNQDKGISVIFSRGGRDHVLYGRGIGFEKLIAITKLDDMVRNAKFCNFKNPDDDDDVKKIVGYMNFKVPVDINGQICHFRIVVRITMEGKFFYDHSVKIKKG
ncbi:MAG: hypothetical protein LBN37_00175 [Bacteroidales bacterium]|jgi:hypothetical protein|nr:hypothetical protein [Bacteroidales bacterium]